MHYDPKTSIAQARIDFGVNFTFSNTRKYGRQFKVWTTRDVKLLRNMERIVKEIAQQYDNVEVELTTGSRTASLHVRVYNEPQHLVEIDSAQYASVVRKLKAANREIDHLLKRLQVANEKLAKISEIAG